VFAPLDHLERLAPFVHDHDRNVFVAVATRQDDRDGTLANCLQLPSLFADIDFKTSTEGEARARLAACPIAPSLRVASGGGLQPYWLLKEPADVRHEADQLREVLRRLAAWLQADVVAGEPARVLRVPETRNHKYTPPRPVLVEHFDPDRRYNVSDFDWLPALPVVAAAVPIDLSQTIGALRNVSLYKLARALKGKQLPSRMVAATVRQVNAECCAPPLEEWEVQQIIRNALSQPDRPRSRHVVVEVP